MTKTVGLVVTRLLNLRNSMKLKPNYNILNAPLYKGGIHKIDGYDDPIVLSANENPFGVSQNVKNCIVDFNTSIYPDGNAKKLKLAISKYYNIEEEKIICGNGSDEILQLIAQAYTGINDEVIYTQHGFLVYKICATINGATPVMVGENNFKVCVEKILQSITNKTKAIFIANPANPTGTYIARDEILHLLENVPENVAVILDCAYAEYVENSDYSECFDLIDEYENLIITHTFSKMFGLAGLRLGWCYAHKNVCDVLNRVRGPFNVSSIAIECGVAALYDKKFIKKCFDNNIKWKQILSDKFCKIGCNVIPSQANFILVDFGCETIAENFYNHMINNGIIARMVGSYGLPNCIRITIGMEAQNLKLIEVIESFKND